MLVLVEAAGLGGRGFAGLWVPTGSVLLLGCSSGMITVGAGAAGEALLVAPLISWPSEEELRLVDKPFTGSFDDAGGIGLRADAAS